MVESLVFFVSLLELIGASLLICSSSGCCDAVA